jgi:NAD-dependent dihydropyrimidine dehydrogenase PreA subunit
MNPETDCKLEPGKVIPIINRNKCEGKADCLEVCPYDVFELRLLTHSEKQQLSRFGRFKLRVHGGKQAFVINADQCQGCSYCIKSCPEKAITLQAITEK